MVTARAARGATVDPRAVAGEHPGPAESACGGGCPPGTGHTET